MPGPYGAGGYYNATPGFQCVELAERFLSVADGLAPVLANGSNLAAAYHAAYRSTSLVVNGTPAAVGHPPRPGGVISFSLVPSFYDPTDGHVAIVVSTNVDARTGNGTVEIAQENVAPGDFRRSLDLLDWRLVDPSEPPNAEFQYPYAEWLNVSPRGGATSSTESARVLMSPMVWHSRTSLAAEMKLRPSAHFRRARRPQLLQPAIGPLLTARLIEGRRALSSSTANR